MCMCVCVYTHIRFGCCSSLLLVGLIFLCYKFFQIGQSLFIFSLVGPPTRVFFSSLSVSTHTHMQDFDHLAESMFTLHTTWYSRNDKRNSCIVFNNRTMIHYKLVFVCCCYCLLKMAAPTSKPAKAMDVDYFYSHSLLLGLRFPHSDVIEYKKNIVKRQPLYSLSCG